MKCPHCGYESESLSIDYGRSYREAVNNRLIEYGFDSKMSPEKYQACTAVRKTISIITGIKAKAGGAMEKASAEKCILTLNSILPSKRMEATEK